MTNEETTRKHLPPLPQAAGTSSSSAAAACMTFSIVGCRPDDKDTDAKHVSSFPPVYTHQIFPNEIIPGYRPMKNNKPNVDDASNSKLVPQPAQHNDDNKAEEERNEGIHHHDANNKAAAQAEIIKELSIHIQLAPSCQVCSVSMETTTRSAITTDFLPTLPENNFTLAAANDDNDDGERPCKRSKTTTTTSHNDDDEASSVELGSEDSITDDEEDLEDEIPQEEEVPLALDQIRENLRPHLPPMVDKINDEMLYLKHPPAGTVLKEYSAPPVEHLRNNVDRQQQQHFVLMLCRGQDSADYHHKMQTLARYFIETADDVDVRENDDWQVLYLFHRRRWKNKQSSATEDSTCTQNYQYGLAGYMTIYRFDSPFRQPVAGSVLRVCQALLLPPYQRRGHGHVMLQCLFDHYCNNNNDGCNVVEINCEDPAPGFAALRLVVDYERYQESHRSWFGDQKNKSIDDADFFVPLSDSEALQATRVARTTTRQVQMVYELDKLRQVQEHTSSRSSTDSADTDESDAALLAKRFRLMVKKRLNVQHREELSACPDKPTMQAKLNDLYKEVEALYLSVLARTNSSGSST